MVNCKTIIKKVTQYEILKSTYKVIIQKSSFLKLINKHYIII